ESALVVRLHLALFAASSGQGALSDGMKALPAWGHLGITVQGVDILLCPVGNLSCLGIAAIIKIDAGIRVITRKDKPKSSPTVGARVFLLPPFQGHREGRYALIEGPPGCGVCRIRVAEYLRVNGDFGEFHLSRLLVNTVGTAPQQPLGAGLEIGRYLIEVLSRRAGIESAALRCHAPTPPSFNRAIKALAAALSLGCGP